VYKGAQCHQTGADGRQDAHQIRVSADIFVAFLTSPCHATPKNAMKKKIKQNNRGRKEKKTEETKAAFFVMSQDGLFRRKKKIAFLKSPCYEKNL
jgi:hypothetical protein